MIEEQSRRMPQGELDAFLATELPRRPPDWPVYLEADPDMKWKYPGQVIDIIHGSRAQVVLLTREQ